MWFKSLIYYSKNNDSSDICGSSNQEYLLDDTIREPFEICGFPFRIFPENLGSIYCESEHWEISPRLIIMASTLKSRNNVKSPQFSNLMRQFVFFFFEIPESTTSKQCTACPPKQRLSIKNFKHSFLNYETKGRFFTSRLICRYIIRLVST